MYPTLTSLLPSSAAGVMTPRWDHGGCGGPWRVDIPEFQNAKQEMLNLSSCIINQEALKWMHVYAWMSLCMCVYVYWNSGEKT